MLVRLPLAFLIVFSVFAADDKTPAPASYQTQAVEGWTVHINTKLLEQEKEKTARALEILTAQLKELQRVVPAPAATWMKKIPLWFSPAYEGFKPTAEYHPDAGWLKRVGRNPAMAKCVEFTDIPTFEAESKRMPYFVLHELAHAFHDQVLGFGQADIVAAYKQARDNKTYDKVERTFGTPKRPNSFERAYGMNNEKEYFAETSEAFFGRNDFFPFDRSELEKHDPTMFKLLERIWNAPIPAKTENKTK